MQGRLQEGPVLGSASLLPTLAGVVSVAALERLKMLLLAVVPQLLPVLFLVDPQGCVNGGGRPWPWLLPWTSQAHALGGRKLRSSRLGEATAWPWSSSTGS